MKCGRFYLNNRYVLYLNACDRAWLAKLVRDLTFHALINTNCAYSSCENSITVNFFLSMSIDT